MRLEVCYICRMKTFFVHFSTSPRGPYMTMSYKTRAEALRAILDAMRQGESARLQVA